MNIKSNFRFRDSVIIRVSVKPIETSFSKKSLLELFQSSEVKEALYLSSPNFFDIFHRYIKAGASDSSEERKILTTLLKYTVRMHLRCTPFGLFAGCSVLKFGEMDVIAYKTGLTQRSTRLDSSSLSDLIKHSKKGLF